ncbi:hypothetical protein QEN19_002285 [Hanseniaspora menglaensis]
MSKNNDSKRLQPVSNQKGAPVKKRDRAQRYSMFYESSNGKNDSNEIYKNEDEDQMIKSNSLNDINKHDLGPHVSSLRHAKNLRSSLFLKQDDSMVEYMNNRFKEMKQDRKEPNFISNNEVSTSDQEKNRTKSVTSEDEEDDESEVVDLSHEVKTMNIQFSSSPSLSALAGYLNNTPSPPKHKNLNVLASKPFNKNMNNIFEEEEDIEEIQKNSPINNSLLEFKNNESGKKDESYASTQRTSDKTKIEDYKQTKHAVSKNSGNDKTVSSFKSRTTSLPKENIPKNQQQEDKQKKTSIFSIFRKKSINRKLSKNENEYLPVSETFSNKSAFSNKSKKSTNVSILRQANNSNTSVEESSSVLGKVRTTSKTDIPTQRKDVGLRQSTPLQNEFNNTKKISISNSDGSNLTVMSSPKILGEDVFPKHLDMLEISSIQTLEKAKRASLTLTPNNKRMSLTDSISVKQENEGMFVEYDSNLQIHTPDLSKSPTSSILRSGRFENNRNSMVFSDSGRSTNRNSLILSENGRRSNRNSRYESRASVLSNGNNNRNSTNYQVIEETSEKPVAPLLDIDFDFEDSEYVSEIMEFKNIIDFGDYIDLDFNLDSINENSSINNTTNKKSRDEDNNMVLNGLGILSSNKDEQKQIVQEEIVPIKSLKVETTADSVQPFLPTISPPSPDTPRRARPLSMSFKGLDTKGLNNSLFDEENESKEINIKTFEASLNEQVEFYDNNEKDVHNDIEEEFYYNEEDDDEEEEEEEEEDDDEEEDFNFYDTLEEDEIEKYNSEMDDFVDEKFLGNNKRSVHFNSKIILFDTYTADEYDRRPDLATCNQLTPELAMFIREEVNAMKGEMDVHEESIQFTHFL